ncbi:plastocyanin/azurin family copper-binding protein [Halosolutus amylolyticus]|uniref:Plastocyanin/azurin family copper-binding protein n=1 Tax=Halosolutus amylolyticus TaxID=2932267 RepID=A0ABD5PPA9_9EURY|nr:plastocyanin/azurin family copper-binding protein [Halosolutus amylolyticus]
MERDDQFSRRRMLQFTGAAAVTTLVAGCADGGGGPGEGEDGEEEEDGAGEGDNETGDGNETEDGEEDGEAISPDDEIELGAEVQAWMGQAPDQIADQENPTLVLQEGESYDITWENLDGQMHNIEIVDDSDEVVDDYSTDEMGEEGETQTLEVDEITSEMAEYVCRPHEGTMRGTIEVESGDGGMEEDGNETDGNETENGNESEDNESEDNESE